MSICRIKSVADGTVLDLSEPIRSRAGELEQFTVSVDAPNMSAVVKVYAFQARSLAPFFADIAQSWRGWSGTKQWSSLEGEFELQAKADRLGHVTLGFTLRSGYDSHDWCATGAIELEAGQLDRIAVDVEEFVNLAA